MNVGDQVQITSCEVCPKMIGKIYTIKKINGNLIELNYGRGRPIDGRPNSYNIGELKLFIDFTKSVELESDNIISSDM